MGYFGFTPSKIFTLTLVHLFFLLLGFWSLYRLNSMLSSDIYKDQKKIQKLL